MILLTQMGLTRIVGPAKDKISDLNDTWWAVSGMTTVCVCVRGGGMVMKFQPA